LRQKRPTAEARDFFSAYPRRKDYWSVKPHERDRTKV
jgi:hypothetical protein